jgi:hypothetical protein
MIRVESITIEEFRGIRKLKLDLAGKNFAVCGPNGTGKSGVVDALEFVLTGSVSRLSGEGRGEVSLTEHGPHVIVRTSPEKSKVTATLSIPSLSKTVTIERSVKAPRKPKITPNDPDVVQVLRDVESHPEIVLSRREIIKYVLATPGDRAQEVQALLRLDPLEKVRGGLQKIANASDRELAPLVGAVTTARDNLLRTTGLDELSKDKLLAAANKQREILGLVALTELREDTSIKDGLAVPAPGAPQRIAKQQAVGDLKAVRDAIAGVATADVKANATKATSEIDALLSDPTAANAAAREGFYSAGVALIVDESCPFCDLKWDSATLKAHLAKKIERLKEITKKRAAIVVEVAPIIERWRTLQAGIRTILQHARLAGPSVDAAAMQSFVSMCGQRIEKLSASRLADLRLALSDLGVAQSSLDVIVALEKVVDGLPEPSMQDAARDWLTAVQERLQVWRDARRAHAIGKARAEKARKIFDAYVASMDKVLAGIYSSVEKDFVAFYSFINRDDEETFQAKLIPSMGKLGFDVNFYGFGFFPPGAYHSEGHQDGMGLCLYLALMRRLQGSTFTFAVLDDVLMSVDSGHRREVCALLKKEFPDTQFVMTTHDPIWLRHMRTEGLTSSKGAIQFRNWNVQQGPTRWDDLDAWAEIEAYLAGNDVRSAAALFRHFLEYSSAELCHRLRARVEYRGDAQYQLGELLPAAISQMKTLFAKAKSAANSWNRPEVRDQIGVREQRFAAVAKATDAEYWYVNPAIHLNSWENLTPAEFAKVVKAFRELMEEFVCGGCSETLRVSPDREAMDQVACGCGVTSMSLREKPR